MIILKACVGKVTDYTKLKEVLYEELSQKRIDGVLIEVENPSLYVYFRNKTNMILESIDRRVRGVIVLKNQDENPLKEFYETTFENIVIKDITHRLLI